MLGDICLKNIITNVKFVAGGEINPYTRTIPLEIHHKDGNYLHSVEDNLMLLCPNCHSLTEH